MIGCGSRVQFLVLPPSSCVTPGKVLYLSEPWFVSSPKWGQQLAAACSCCYKNQMTCFYPFTHFIIVGREWVCRVVLCKMQLRMLGRGELAAVTNHSEILLVQAQYKFLFSLYCRCLCKWVPILHVETEGSRLLSSYDSAISWGFRVLLPSQWKRKEKAEKHLGNVIHGGEGWQLPLKDNPILCGGAGVEGCVFLCMDFWYPADVSASLNVLFTCLPHLL